MPYESEKLKSRVFYYLCMVLAGCILANIVLRCDRNLQVFILPFTDSSRLAGVSVQQTLFYVLLQRTKQVAVVYLLYKVFPPSLLDRDECVVIFIWICNQLSDVLSGTFGCMVSAVMPVSALSDLSWNVVLSGGRGTQGWRG